MKHYFDFIVFRDFVSDFPELYSTSEVVKYHYHFMWENYSTKVLKASVYSHPEIRELTSKVMNLGSSQIFTCTVQRGGEQIQKSVTTENIKF